MAAFIVWLIGLSPAMAPLIGVLALMGTLRTINKILFTFLMDISMTTKTKYDDDLMASLSKNKVYTSVCYLLDLFASIKLPEKAAKVEAPKA